jgi:hypothetical protein
MAGKKGGHAGYKAVAFLKHAGKQLLGDEILGAVRKRAVHHITPAHMRGVASPASFAKGGKVKKTGHAKVHKGEVVLTKKSVSHLKKILQ